MRKLSQVLMLTAYLALGTFAQHAVAESNAFHQESKRYLVYLGVVPASLLKKEPERVDRDKQLHGGIAAQTPAAQHVMVTIFRKDGNVRVLDATVIATVRPGKLFTRKAEEKPLEKMITGGAVAYGNFFDMPKSGDYRIDVVIYDAKNSGSESVRFDYTR